MPTVPTHSPTTHRPVPQYYIHTASSQFVDTAGRTLILRGVNLSGASKAPPLHLSHVLEDFWDSVVPYEDDEDEDDYAASTSSSSSSSSRTRTNGKGKSFVNRPLNIDDGSADIHLARLRSWGFNLIRFVFTWEALEHEGPGKYDYEFIDYTIRVLQKCKDYGFRVYMDPHQDTWSRFSGGSGAPYWTLPACGIDPLNITTTQAAIIHCEYTPTSPSSSSASDDPGPDPAALPAMIWSTNYGRLLSQTVFTLFFAGRTFAPKCIIDGVNIQDFLQSHYLNAVRALASAILSYDNGSLYDECIIGWDCINEPFEGLVGWEDLNINPKGQGNILKRGTAPTPAQSLRLGMGKKQKVELWTMGSFGPKKSGSVVVDPKGKKIWADNKDNATDELTDNVRHRRRRRPIRELSNGYHPFYQWTRDVASWPLGSCIWAQHGVWDIETGYILQPDYFRYDPSTGVEVEFVVDYWKAHFLEYQKVVRQFHPESISFVHPPVFVPPPHIKEDEDEAGDSDQLIGLHGRACYSTHYYDGLTLITRHWNWFNADALGILRGKYSSVYQAVKIGEPAIRKSLREQLGMLKADAKLLGAYPTVVGEIGTPFDMDDRRAYTRDKRDRNGEEKYLGVYDRQERALDASLNACDGDNGLSYSMWTFCPDDHSHAWGDGWNLEDLSLWSPDDVWAKRHGNPVVDCDGSSTRVGDYDGASVDSDMEELQTRGRTPYRTPAYSSSTLNTAPTLNVLGTGPVLPSDSDTMKLSYLGWHKNPYDFLRDGARAVRAFSRPYPIKTIGTPVGIDFDMQKAVFKLVVRVTSADGLALKASEVKLATEVFVPVVHFVHPKLLCPEADIERRKEKSLYAAAVAGAYSSTTTLMGAVYEQDDEDVVAIDVVSSPGTSWTLKGQTLSWWYSAPAVGEEEVEFTLEVRRRGGAVKRTVEGREDPVSKMPARPSVKATKRSSFTSGLCQTFCCSKSDSGCVIM